MPTDTRSRTDTIKFAFSGVAWSLGFFGLLRLGWIEMRAVLPFTQWQAAAATGIFGASALPVEVTLACSGADAMALCLGSILAYPVTWRARLAGVGGGLALILGLNIFRIGTLGRVVGSPALFNTLHLYVWPAVLTLAIAGYVFGWMHLADRRRPPPSLPPGGSVVAAPALSRPAQLAPQPSRRFVLLTAAFVVLFVAASPLYLESAGVFAVAGFIARAAASTLGAAGVSAHAAANILWTPRGGFLVTQECISTPLIPVYLAAIVAYSGTWRRMTLGILATVPLFVALGIMRLLVVALPNAVISSPLFFVHAFYQLLLGAVIVSVAALWRHGGKAALGPALVGALAGVAFAHLIGPAYTRLISYPSGVPLDDPQGAIAFLPAFQIGLYIALWVAAFVAVGWRRFLTGLAVLGLTQTAGLLALHAAASHAGLAARVTDVRAWAVAVPLLIVTTVANFAWPRR